MSKVFISQSNYIPWKGYFDNIALCDYFVIYDDMQFTKRDWRNRNYINTANGLSLLTIPVLVKGKYFQKINETIIADTNWNKVHWSKIEHNYKKSDYFKQIGPVIKEWYMSAKQLYLSDINRHFLVSICDYLGIKTILCDSREFYLAEDRNDRLINIVKKLGGTEYFTGPAAKVYLDEMLFKKEGINISYFDYSNYPVYNQNTPNFEHGVSIIDLIINTGPQFKTYLKNLK